MHFRGKKVKKKLNKILASVKNTSQNVESSFNWIW